MKKIITIILISVGVIGIGIGSYFAYGYFNKPEACGLNNTTTKVSTKVDLVTQNVLKDIINIKVNWFFTEDYTNFNTLNNRIKFYIGNINNNDYILADKIDDNLANIFGDTVTIGKANIMCFANDYIMYDYSSGYFQKHDQSDHPGHGGTVMHPDYTNFVKFEKVGNKYIVYTNEVYFDEANLVYNTGDNDNIEVTNNDTAEEIFNDNYAQIKNDLNLRKYTFEIENNRYILKSFKIVE
ncbi:MAG TPA: hypothetical protein PKY25_02205 [Bacilli bacterium]|nr:hypothetical protein [Bacilli bacterium]